MWMLVVGLVSIFFGVFLFLFAADKISCGKYKYWGTVQDFAFAIVVIGYIYLLFYILWGFGIDLN